LLQLVNSAFFSSAREITDMLDAAMILGTERIKSLILLAGIFSQYGSSGPFAAAVQALLAHSIQVGTFSRAIALSETKSQAMAEAAFTAGILHDVGKLIVAGNMPEMFDQVQKLKTMAKLPERAAEMQVYGVNHTKLGACLLAAWGLPLPILEAIAYHNDPQLSSSKTFSLLAAVHAANAFAHASDTPSPKDGGQLPSSLNLPYLERIGKGDRAERWRELCGEVN
jgi:putative nucleotidyltransferase with HDIG domain